MGFLVIAITATYTKQVNRNIENQESLKTVNDTTEYHAELTSGEKINREANLADLKNKIAALNKNEVISKAEPTVPVSVPEEIVAETKKGVQECAGFIPSPFSLKPGVKFEVVEGARILYYEEPVTSMATDTADLVMDKNLVLQLPVRSFPMSPKNCLPTDIVGIALDGSMIRNTDYRLYSIFGSDTLIGYSLDGFLIYGQNEDVKLDECGGAIVNNEYHYYLSADRDSVLNCYSGIPVKV